MTTQNGFTQEQIFEHIQHLLGPCELCDEIKAAISENAALKAEVELLNQNAMKDYAAHLELKCRAEKAEAELTRAGLQMADRNIHLCVIGRERDALKTKLDEAIAALQSVDDDVATGNSGLMHSTRSEVRKALVHGETREPSPSEQADKFYARK